MTFSKLINAEQKNEHKIMKDAHIAETDKICKKNCNKIIDNWMEKPS